MTAKISIIIISFIFLNLLIRVSSDACQFGTTYDEDTSKCIECGKTFFTPNIKIIGGVKAKPYSWPAQVAIFPGEELCGGSLITPWCVLTAAHCTFGKTARRISAYLGAFDLGRLNKLPTVRRRVARIIQHPNYDNFKLTNDIAILKLTQRVPLNKYIQLACLPPDTTDFPRNGRTVYAAGWGNRRNRPPPDYPDLLHNVKMGVTNNNCDRNDSKTQFCAGARGKDTCQGDSGGGLYTKYDDKLCIGGIVSYGDGCGRKPGVYTRVSAYLDWIDDNCNTSGE